ncbi:hypothetical protein [Streptomyces sp. UG1]|uniref:hypothetical protein n=1 Tax=Streptomyces sp. UG1 TaxID=3417652 RepID=UPI003CF96DB2
MRDIRRKVTSQLNLLIKELPLSKELVAFTRDEYFESLRASYGIPLNDGSRPSGGTKIERQKWFLKRINRGKWPGENSRGSTESIDLYVVEFARYAAERLEPGRQRLSSRASTDSEQITVPVEAPTTDSRTHVQEGAPSSSVEAAIIPEQAVTKPLQEPTAGEPALIDQPVFTDISIQSDASLTLSEEPQRNEPDSPEPLPERKESTRTFLIRQAFVSLALAVTLPFTFLSWPNDTEGTGEEWPGDTLNSSPKPPAKLPIGDALNVNAYSVTGMNGAWSAAVPDNKVDLVTKPLQGYNSIGVDKLPAGFRNSLEEHGYLLGELRIQFAVKRLDDDKKDIEIIEVRPVDIKKQLMPTGAAFLMPPSKDSDWVSEAEFYMGTPAMEAVYPADDDDAGTPYFQEQRKTLNFQGDEEVFSLAFFAFQGAYTFKIAVDYEAGGSQYRTYVTDENGPETFKLTADPCPHATPAQEKLYGYPSKADLEAVQGIRYGELWIPSRRELAGGESESMLAHYPGKYTTAATNCARGNS